MSDLDLFSQVDSLLDGPKLSVTEFNQLIKDTVSELGLFRVQGEVTEFTITTRKGVYLTLADKKSNLKVSGYAPTIKGINLIQKGMQVIATGKPDVYVPYGSLTLNLISIEPVGEGSLAIAYERLKTELKAKGIFDDKHKIPLPSYITRIALLSGKDSAAYADFTKILRENNQSIELDFYPVIVQGPNSVQSVRKAFNKAQLGSYDVIILARGGGSLEDLKSFNDEEIVMDIFKSKTPIIVGVGHESDESLADFAADVTASTPSQAAYYIVNQNKRFIDLQVQKLSFMRDIMITKLVELKSSTNLAQPRMLNDIRNYLNQLKDRSKSLERILKPYNINSILDRGFVFVQKEGKEVKLKKLLSKGDNVILTFADGKIGAIID